jgi:hypothetical protein
LPQHLYLSYGKKYEERHDRLRPIKLWDASDLIQILTDPLFFLPDLMDLLEIYPIQQPFGYAISTPCKPSTGKALDEFTRRLVGIVVF